MPAVTESTTLGAAFAAGLFCGIWKDTKEIESLVSLKGQIEANMDRKKQFDTKYVQWTKTINYLLKMEK